jgi:phosphatidylglycerophosphate synthase
MRYDDSYSTLERRLLPLVRRSAAAVWTPIIAALARLHVSPHAVSASQLAWAAVFWLSLATAPRLALVAFILALLMDSLDGALARATSRSSAFGALVDQLSDHTRETIVVAALASSGALNVALAVLYAFVYPAFNFLLLVSNRVGIPVPATLKTLFLFYPTIVVYLVFDVNLLDLGIGLALISMLVSGALALVRLRRALA